MSELKVEWRKTSDCFPPKDMPVLVKDGDNFHVAEYDHDMNLFFNGDIYLYEVKLWMHIPEPTTSQTR